MNIKKIPVVSSVTSVAATIAVVKLMELFLGFVGGDVFVVIASNVPPFFVGTSILAGGWMLNHIKEKGIPPKIVPFGMVTFLGGLLSAVVGGAVLFPMGNSGVGIYFIGTCILIIFSASIGIFFEVMAFIFALKKEEEDEDY